MVQFIVKIRKFNFTLTPFIKREMPDQYWSGEKFSILLVNYLAAGSGFCSWDGSGAGCV
jgi:hypothetical protein